VRFQRREKRVDGEVVGKGEVEKLLFFSKSQNVLAGDGGGGGGGGVQPPRLRVLAASVCMAMKDRTLGLHWVEEGERGCRDEVAVERRRKRRNEKREPKLSFSFIFFFFLCTLHNSTIVP